MARKTKKPHTTSSASKPPRRTAPRRRAMLGTLALYGAGAAVVLGGGGALAMDFRNTLSEADLSKVGNGLPTIVQIHDPRCSLCRALQKETRQALKECDTDDTQYLVANIATAECTSVQTRIGLPHVTLVLFDGAGTYLHTIQGVTPSETIKADRTRFPARA